MAETSQEQAEDPRAKLENLQKKFDALVQRRNELNDASRQLRQERDLLHDARKEFKERMDKAKAQRDAINAKMREAKGRRNELQKQAKDLIASRQKKGGDVSKSLPLQARQLEKQVRDLENKQQTQPLSIEAERDLVKLIQAKGAELKQIKGKLEKDSEVKVDLDNLDEAINELFKQADAAHAEVQAYHKEASKHHEEFVKAVEEAKVLTREANEKHKSFVESRKRADEVHHKAMELREQMIAIRGERRAEFEARKAELREYNQGARQAVADPKRMEEKADESLEALKKGGKISFGV